MRADIFGILDLLDSRLPGGEPEVTTNGGCLFATICEHGCHLAVPATADLDEVGVLIDERLQACVRGCSPVG